MSIVNYVMKNSSIVLNVLKTAALNVKMVESHQIVTVKTDQLKSMVHVNHVVLYVRHVKENQAIVVNVLNLEPDHLNVLAQVVFMKQRI